MAIEEVAGCQDLFQILLARHVADARGGAEFKVAVEAVLIVLFARSKRTAAAQVELAANQLERVTQRARTGEWAEIPGAIFLLEPRESEAWNRIIEIDLQEEESLVIPKADVVAGVKLLNQFAFQQDGFRFASNDVNVEIMDGFDQSIERVEKLFLRATLVREELDVVDQQEIERVVVALELVERLLLVGAYYVGNVLFGMYIPNARLRPSIGNLVANGLHEVRLTQANAAVNEQRVVRGPGIFGYLDGRSARELVRLAGDEAVERKTAVEPRAFLDRWLSYGTARLYRRPRRNLRRTRQHQPQAELAAARLGGETLDSRRESLPHELQHEAVGRGKRERIVGRIGLGRERPDPGVELLRGQLLLESTQAGVPEGLHLLVGLKRAPILPWRGWVIHSARAEIFRFDNAFWRTL